MARDLGVKITEKGKFYYISYNSEDQDKVSKYVKELDLLGCPMWYDKGFSAGNTLQAELSEKIAECQAIIMFISKGVFKQPKSFFFIENTLATKYYNKDVYLVCLDEIEEKDVPYELATWWIELKTLCKILAYDYPTEKDCAKKVFDLIKNTNPNPISDMPLDYEYTAPTTALLDSYGFTEDKGALEDFTKTTAEKIICTYKNLGDIDVNIVNVVHGATLTRIDISYPKDLNVKHIIKYCEDVQFRLASPYPIRMVKHPTKEIVSVEIPRKTFKTVGLKEVVDSSAFKNAKKDSLTFALGKNVEGESIVANVCKMPNLLVLGSAGTGKSVMLNSMLLSLMMKHSPKDLRFIIVDPKFVEFNHFKDLPHLLFNEIITDNKLALSTLDWIIKEIDERRAKLENKGVRTIDEYNEIIDTTVTPKMYKIVVIIDEFTDLLISDRQAFIDKIETATLKGDVVGVHFVLASQRLGTGEERRIGDFFNTRISFRVSSSIDSHFIIGECGAEQLIGAGDLLYTAKSTGKISRAQGAYVSMNEVKKVLNFIKENNESYYHITAFEEIKTNAKNSTVSGEKKTVDVPSEYVETLRFAIENGTVSISLIQRKMGFGFPKSAKIFEWMVSMGYVIYVEGAKLKKVVLTMEEFKKLYGSNE